MRGDKTDLVAPIAFQGSSIKALAADMPLLALRAVESGCSHKSPFLHASWDYWIARKWLERGRVRTRDTNNYLVSIGLDHFDPSRVIDFSSVDAMRAWLGRAFERPEIQDLATGRAGSMACGDKEVLLLWRGDIPEEAVAQIGEDGPPPTIDPRRRALQASCL